MITPARLPPELVAHFTDRGLWRDTLTDSHLAAHARADGARLAVVDRDRSVSYAELDALVNRTASALRARGIDRGDVVAWQLPNWVEAFAVHHGAIRIGAVSNPIIPIYRHREMEFILRQSGAKIVIGPSVFRGFDHAAMLVQLRDELPALRDVVVVGGQAPAGALPFAELLAAGSDGPPAAERGANDVTVLLYTSGTTADPKGALHTHNTLDYENRSIIELFGLGGHDVVFMPSPVAHITGVLYALQLPFMLGTHVVLQDVWEPGRALELLERHRCSFTVAATPFLHGILHHPDRPRFDLGSFTTFACGGADVPPELIRHATRELGCMAARAYGSTEFPTLSAGNAADPVEKRATTDGRRIGAAEAKVLGLDGRPVAPGVAGELFVRGPELFVGYLDAGLDEEAFDAEGWFATGDLAVLDAEGYVQITGRRKDIIIRGGENISAKEVEDLLFEHPAVREVAVVGMPDPVLVERICAYVVPEDDAAVELADLVAFLRGRRIANQKLPERLEVVTEMPRTASGKIQKFRLREDVRRRLTEGVAS
ncbi:AMP-binding protein [Pseudonocardia broussonetiae]|uniref:AMP-binding protein n=1 Tax=Pseudonocardia broussonetiae TaxID=2736640 RepID=A0A6M6JPR7_9PSEU|nr:AMP-binding protein [Pseudonocardia broussonetiae]QJY50024.1 AMP-binding protein [Pseudonocardia broussonetiae]